MFRLGSDDGFDSGQFASAENGAASAGTDKAFDPDLLFHARFNRSGDDLRLMAHERTEVVLDYFAKDGEFAALRATNGAVLSGDLVRALTGRVAPGHYAQAGDARAVQSGQQDIGHIAKLQGAVTIVRNGVAMIANVGDVVLRGDVVQTGNGAVAGLVFKDGSAFEIFSDARLVLTAYDYKGPGLGGSQYFDLVQGKFSFASGDIAASGDMRIGTAGGIAKIHGTAGGGEIASDAGQVKLYIYHQRDDVHEATIYDSAGSVVATLRSDGGRVILTPTPSSGYATVEVIKTLEDLAAESRALYDILKLKNGADGDIVTGSIGVHGSSYIAQAADTASSGLVAGPPPDAIPLTVYPPTSAPSDGLPPQAFNDYIPNYNPVGAADAYSVDEDGIMVVLPAGLLANDRDPEGATLSLAPHTNPLHGTLALNSDGSFVYTPDADYNGVDTFQYLPYDGTLNGDPVTVTLTVNSVNDAPVLGLNPASTPIVALEQTAIALFPALALTDIDSRTMAKVTVTISANYQSGEDVLSFTDTASIHGVFDAATGALTLTAVPGTTPSVADFEAALRAVTYVDTIDNPTQLERTISVLVQDPDGVARNGHDMAQASATLTVTPVNDVPTFVAADSLAVTEDQYAAWQDIPATTGSLTVNDRDIGDHLTASVTGDAVATYSGGALPPGVDIAALIAAGAVTFTDATTTGQDLALQWTYDPAIANLDWLPEGATLTLTYTAQLNDGAGDTGAQPLTIVITGTNDNPSGYFISYAGGTEADDASAQALSVNGAWSVSDADIGDVFTPIVTGNTGLFYSGGDLPANIDLSALIDPATMSFAPATSNGGAVDIAWSYNAAAVNLDWLAYGQALYISFAVTVGDGTAASGQSSIYIIIEGTNDAPMITGATSLSVAETFDIAPVFGTLTVNDVDIGDGLTGSVTGDATAVWSGGTLPPWVNIAPLLADSAVIFGATVSNGGDTNLAWIYNPQAANVEWLAAGATLTITYTAQVNDGFGNVGSQPLTIVITGTNDDPSGYFVSDAWGTEAADASAQALTVAGTWSVSDADIGDVLTPTVSGVGDLYYTGGNLPAGVDFSALIDPSTMSFTPTTSTGGATTISWQYNAPAVNLDWIAAGQQFYIYFSVTLGDGTTTTDPSYFYVFIEGTNDAPTITCATTLNFTELANASAQDIAATSGTLTVHDLDIGDTMTGSVTGNATAVWSGGALPAGVNIAALVARNAVTFGSATSNGGDANLSWTYNPAAANLNWLAKDATLTLTYTAQVNDGYGNVGSQPLAIVITGTNDGPTGSLASLAGVTEAVNASAQALSVSGAWTVTDADIGDVLTPVLSGHADLYYTGGNLPAGADLSALIATSAISFTPTISNGGTASIAWSYNAAAVNLDWLANGKLLYISYLVTVGDGTAASTGTSYIRITVAGTNDAPIITGATNPASVIAANLDQTLVTGTLTVKDADIGDSLSGSVIGSATIHYSGGTLPNTANAAAFASASAISFAPATSLGADQPLTWKYTPADGSFGWLRPGETVTLTYYAQVNDGAGNVGNQPIIVTISGSNNAPSIAAGSSSQIAEAADASHQSVATNGTLTVRDVNYGDALTATVSGPATATYSGTLPNGISLSALTAASALSFGTATANGGDASLGWSYNAGSMNLDWMRAGTSITVTYTVVANDTVDSSNASTVRIVINGSNDAPAITAVSNPSGISESQAGISALAGTLSVIDLDAGDTLSASVTGAAVVSYSGGSLPSGVSAATLGAAAAITLGGGTSNGGSVALNWSYAATPGAFDWLGAGETVTLTYTARVNDGTGNTGSQPLVITIHGENDGPVLTSGAQTAAITEDFTYTVQTTSVVQNGGFETVTNVNNVYTYAGWTAAGFLYPPGDANGAHSGAHDVSFASRQFDPPGTWSQNIDTVAGVTYTLEFWAIPTFRAGSSLSVSWNGQTILAYTDMPFAPTMNPSSPADYVQYTVDVMGTGTSSPLVFSIYSPYYFFLDDVSLKAVITPGLETAKGSITFTDADRTDTHTVSVAANNNIGNFTASLVNDSTGGATGKINWSYNVNDAAVSYLAAQQTLNQTYKVLINDGHGGVTTQDVVVTVTGVNDAPVLNTQASVALTPQVRGNAAPVGAVGTLVSQLAGIGANITDADDGSVAGIAITGTSGMAGTWYYSTNNGATWTAFTASASSARLLLADGATRIYFQPSSSTATGTGTITFQAWDSTTGTNGGTGNASASGGTTAFSTASDTASVYVGTTSSSTTTLTSSSDTVFFASGTNTVNASLLSFSSTLSTSDSLTGGTGIDTLALTVNSGSSNTQSFDFSAMTRFLGFDVVRLASNPSRNTSLTFGNANITSNATMTVDGSAITTAARAFTVNASGVNNGGSFIFVAGASTATSFTGGSGNDTFRLTNAQFALTGHVLAGGAGTDTISMTNAATIADSAFTGVSGVERLQLGNFSNAVTLGALASAAFAGRSLTIDDSAATAGSNLTVNGAAFTADLVVIAGAGNDSLTGGAGDDVFQFTSANLTASDTVVGGGGSDTIQIVDAANLADAAFAGVSGIETLLLGDFTNNVTLGGLAGTAIGSGNTFAIDGSPAAAGKALTVNATALTASAHLSIFGGAGDDTFVFANAHFSSNEHISGGAGRDTIQIADAATVVDSDFANVTSVEVLKLGDFTNSVTLGSSAAAAGGGSITVDGSAGGAGSSLTVDASAMGASSHVTVIGGAGNDVMIGSAGSDVFSGGAGSDTFVFTNPQHSLAASFDTVTDFVSGVDVFQIGHALTNLSVGITGAGTGDLIADLARLLDASNLTGNGAAQVSLTGGSNAGTYLVIGDAFAGFDGAHDAVVHLANAPVLHAIDFIV